MSTLSGEVYLRLNNWIDVRWIGPAHLRSRERQEAAAGGLSMLIAILYALGVGAAGILLLLVGLMLFKRYNTIKHPAVFKARVRLTEGEFPGLKSTWQKCYGAWVTTVFTTRKGLPLNIAAVLPVASFDYLRDAAPTDEVKGLGDHPVIATFSMTTGAKFEVAVSADERPVGLKPWQAQAEQLARTL